jgi:Zn-dependent protease with chaperone function
LYLTNLLVCVLILLQAAVVVAAIYYAESIYTGRVHVKLILVVALGAGLGVIYLINASLGIVHKAKTGVVGKSLSREDYPGLWKYVNELSAEVGTVGPKNLVVGLEPNFYVTEADVRCLDGELTGRTMYISLALCRIMTVPELKAVIAHELGHFKGWSRLLRSRVDGSL